MDVPAGVADHRTFLNTIVVGGYARVVRRRERWRRFVGKWPAASLAFAAAALRPSPRTLVLESGDETVIRTTGMVWIGFGRHAFPRSRPAHSGPYETSLEIAVLRGIAPVAALRLLARIARRARRGRSSAHEPALEIFHRPSLLIHDDAPIHATLDGEPTTFPSPLFVAAQPGALRLRVP